VAAITLAAAIAYWPAFSAGFVYDDHAFVEHGADVHGALGDIWAHPQSPDYWPLTVTTFWLESRLAGDDPAVMHATNVALHVLAALLLWRVLAGLSISGAAVAALLFAAHPVNVESVAWISERKNVLSAALLLAATLAWIRFNERERTRYAVATVALFVFGCLAKTAGILWPVVLLGVSAYRSSTVPPRQFKWLAALFAAALGLGVATAVFQWSRAMPVDAPALTTGADRIAGAAWALAFYVQKAFVPTGLAFVYPEWPSVRGVAFHAAPALLAVAGAAAWILRRRIHAPTALAFGYLALMVLPVLGLVDTAFSRISPVANHYAYLAVMGPLAVVGAGLRSVIDRAPRAGAALTAILLAALGATTLERAAAFKDDLALWSAASRDAPGSMYAALRYNDELLDRGRSEEAARALAAFVERATDPEPRHRSRGVLLFDLGRYPESVDELLAAHAIRPTSLEVVIGGQLVDADRCDDAIRLLSPAVASLPTSVEARYSLGAALLCAGRAEESVALFRRSVEELPGNRKLEAGLVAAELNARSKRP
jgi:protein O-mannosyl-transferase